VAGHETDDWSIGLGEQMATFTISSFVDDLVVKAFLVYIHILSTA
jgi:hypothetical protein